MFFYIYNNWNMTFPQVIESEYKTYENFAIKMTVYNHCKI